MTLKQLEAFYWAATCRNFAIAASRLDISISSLSKRLAELELSIGADLFTRTARSATLTPLGEQLVPHAKELLRSADQFTRRASNRMTLSGRCRFGVGELTSLSWMPKLISAIQAAHPALSIEPTVDVGEWLEKGLEEGELDFAIIAGPSTRTAIASSVIGEARFEWVTTRRAVPHPEALPPEALADLTLVTLPQSAGTVLMLDTWLTDQHTAPGRHLSCNNWGAVAGLIREGLGVGFLPTAWAELLIARGDLAPLPHFPPLRPLTYTYQWRRDDTRPMVQAIRELAQQTVDFHAPTCLI